MKIARRWVAVIGACAVVGLVLVIWFAREVSACQFREDTPMYSPDGKFYSQMELTVCRDHSRSHARLVMGAIGRQDKTVLIDFAPTIGTLNLSWRDGPELHVQVAESAIIKRYGPYDDLPRVVVSKP